MKVKSRTIIIALGIVCIALAVILAGAALNYTSIINSRDSNLVNKDSEIQALTNQKNQLQICFDGNITYYTSQINSLNSQISLSNTQITNLQNQISNLNVQIASLNAQINDWNAIVNLQKSEVLVIDKPIAQGAYQESRVVFYPTPYCGYFNIISTSDTSTAYIICGFWFQGKLYTYKYTVGTAGNLIIPVLKSDSCSVFVGNAHYYGANHVVTVIYYY
jgi:hypothetical protein